MMKYLCLVALILVYCSNPAPSSQKDSIQVKVQTVVLKPQRFSSYGVFFGVLRAAETANLICYSGGRVESINVVEGQRVKKGKSLAKIDSAKALSVLHAANAQERIAYSTLEQTKRHLLNGNASQLAVDQQNLVFINAHSTYVEALKNYQGSFAITPVSGEVTKRFIEPFQELPPNTQTFSISRLDTIKVTIGITESDIYNVNVGSNAILTIPVNTEKKWYGKVKNLSRAAGEQDRVFSAELFFDNNENELKPGTSGRIQLTLSTCDSAIVIPSNVITVEGINSTVMVVDTSNIAHRRFIKTGFQSDTETMVTEGLNFGEQVITEGYQLVREGSKVTIASNGPEQ
jgi:RND family efflux transporter MFP subunit